MCDVLYRNVRPGSTGSLLTPVVLRPEPALAAVFGASAMDTVTRVILKQPSARYSLLNQSALTLYG